MLSQDKPRVPDSSQNQIHESARAFAKEALPEPFAKFDDRIAAASDRIFPKQPYLITIPSEKPFRRHANDQTRWHMHTPFSRKEEQLQYMSFLLHQDDDEVLMMVDGTRIDDDGRLLPPTQSPPSESQSRPQTPIDVGPKKKISLKDYTTKDKSAINTPERKPADDMRRQAIKSRKEEVEAKLVEQDTKPVRESNALHPEAARKTVSARASAPAPAPAPAPSKEVLRASNATPTLQDKNSQRPAKKRRLSVDDSRTPVAKPNGAKLKEEPVEKRSLPMLLSPDMPAPEKSKKVKDLPELLSPKLPPTLEKAVRPPVPRSEEVKAIISAGLGSPAIPADKKEVGAKDSSGNRVRSESQLSIKSAQTIKVSSPIVRPQSSASNKATQPNGQAPTMKSKPRLEVVLRYGKKNRKRVKMLMDLTTRPRKDSVAPERAASKTVPTVESIKPENKRPVEPTPDAPAKKPKLAASLLETPVKLERPATPKADAGKSPQPLKHKSAFSTPKKDVKPDLKPDLKSITMQRVVSSDTLGVRTPSQETARTSTPLGTGPLSHLKTSPAPTSTPARTDDSLAWTDIHTKVFQIGRVLKKDGSKLTAEGKGKDQARGVVLLIEGLVCFMLNSAAQAQSRPSVDPGWSTILPYHVMVWRQSRPFRHLHGLVVQLGAVCRQHLNHEQIKRLSKETFPDDHMTSAPTPGSDGLTKGTEDSAKRQKTFLEFRDELVQNSKELRTAWLESSRQLPAEVIEEQYPTTWAKRSKDLTKRSPDRVAPKEIAKEFYIPVDVTTSVFEASNFALAFLHEWTLIEGVTWKTQVDLTMGPL